RLARLHLLEHPDDLLLAVATLAHIALLLSAQIAQSLLGRITGSTSPGDLPVGEHLRAAIPLPEDPLEGMTTIGATLLIAPRVDAEHPGAYTRSGVSVAFRPHADKYRTYKNGSVSKHPQTIPFFSEKNMYCASEYQLRADGQKWEPCLSSHKRFRASSLNQPCFDIKYEHREGVRAAISAQAIPYAMVVTVKAKRVPDLYNQVVRAYRNVLVPIQPRLRIPVRT
ncbi:MAG: hypothetical protein AAF481_10555, partial [Acidobacteriota bacterium]